MNGAPRSVNLAPRDPDTRITTAVAPAAPSQAAVASRPVGTRFATDRFAMGKKTMGFALLAGATATTALACTLVPTPTGLLGNGTFTYLCPTASATAVDPGCPTPNGWPENAVAVGASFQVAYAPFSQNGTTVEGPSFYSVTPASPSLVSVSDGGLVATSSGYEALLAYSGTVVDDFVFIRIAALDHLVPSVTPVMLDENFPLTLSVQPADASGNILAGQLPCTWSVTTGSNVIDLTIGSASTSVRLQGVTDGTATVHAVCGAASLDVNVNVSGFDASASDGGTESSPSDGGAHG
jgi:hypothetical protein